MKKYLEIMRKCPLFKDIEDTNILSILSCMGAKTETYKKGTTILGEGGPAKYVGIVLSGGVQIVRVDYYGNRSIVTILEPPHMFGESFACAEVKTMPVNVIASEDSEIMLIDARRITTSCGNACEFHNQMIFNLLRIVAIKNLIFNQKIEITSKRTTREKLMTYLLSVAKQQGSNTFNIPYNRQQLADYLEVERSGLSSEIGKLKKDGVIDCRKNVFSLKPMALNEQ